MNDFFSFRNLIVFVAYSLNFIFCLCLYAYLTIEHKFLKQGAILNDDLIYLPLDKIYLGILLVCFLYYTFFTTRHSNSTFYNPKYSKLLSVGWALDSILLFTFFAYCVAVNYITYYPENHWTAYTIIKTLLLTKPSFYISLFLYILIHCLIYYLATKKRIHA